MSTRTGVFTTGMLVLLGGCSAQDDGAAANVERTDLALERTSNPSGVAETLHLTGAIDRTNPFFQPLGTNPRTCETCHSPAMGWTTNRETITRLFRHSQGLDPLFNLVDGG